jgi:hypothetical protein
MALDVGGIFARLGARLDDTDSTVSTAGSTRPRPRPSEASTPRSTSTADRAERGLRRYDEAVDKTHPLAWPSCARRPAPSAAGIGTIGKGAAFAAGPAAMYGLFKAGQSAFGAFKESERVGRQTNAVLKSTGGAAGVTAKQVGDLATASATRPASTTRPSSPARTSS